MAMTEAEQATMRTLEEQVARLTASVESMRAERQSPPPQQVVRPHAEHASCGMSRRTMLRSLAGAGAGAAIGAVVAAAVVSPAGATQDQPVIAGQENSALDATKVTIGAEPSTIVEAALVGNNSVNVGVAGVSDQGLGVWGICDSGDGVNGESDSGRGVSGVSRTAVGVNGFSSADIGVQGYGAKIGVNGATFTGLGGSFAGGRAPIRLTPRPQTGRPTSGIHERGELVVDNLGALFICTANGTPGTWRRVTTTAA